MPAIKNVHAHEIFDSRSNPAIEVDVILEGGIVGKVSIFTVTTNIGQIKNGYEARTGRVAKYNRLLRIEEQIGSNAVFPGKKLFYNI